MNIDEESNYEVATNHYKGRGYTYFDEQKNTYLNFVFPNLFLDTSLDWDRACSIIENLLAVRLPSSLPRTLSTFLSSAATQ